MYLNNPKERFTIMTFKPDIINKFQNHEIQPHKKNTLDFVVAILQYDNLSKWLEEIQTYFYESIKEEYPFKETFQLDQRSFQLTPVEITFTQTQAIGYLYIDDTENPTHRIVIDFQKIEFHCINPEKNYLSFDKFYERFKDICDHLNTAISTATDNKLKNFIPQKISLRQINKIENTPANIKFLNNRLIYEQEVFTDNDFGMSYKEFSSKEPDGDIVIARSGIIDEQTSGTIKKYFVYDFEVLKDNPKNISLEPEIFKKSMYEFRRKIYNLFRYCIGEGYINNVLDKEE